MNSTKKNRTLAKTQSGNVLEYFLYDGIGNLLRPNLGKSRIISAKMQLNFGSDTIKHCLWITSFAAKEKKS